MKMTAEEVQDVKLSAFDPNQDPTAEPEKGNKASADPLNMQMGQSSVDTACQQSANILKGVLAEEAMEGFTRFQVFLATQPVLSPSGKNQEGSVSKAETKTKGGGSIGIESRAKSLRETLNQTRAGAAKHSGASPISTTKKR